MIAYRRDVAGRVVRLLSVFLSLFVSIAAAVLWVRSYRTNFGECVTVKSRGGGYVISSRRGRLILLCPPRAATAGEAAAVAILAGVDNDQVTWVETRRFAGGTPMRRFQPSLDDKGGRVDDLYALPPADVVRGLLGALDDPRRFWAAHVLLSNYQAPNGFRLEQRVEEREGQADVTWCGVRVTLRLKNGGLEPEAPQAAKASLSGWTVTVPYRGGDVRLDAAQRGAALTYWSQRLNSQVFAASYAWPLLAGLVLPGLHTRAAMRRRERSRNRQCLECGYDLRASADRCPECGAATLGEFVDVKRRGKPPPAFVRSMVTTAAAMSFVLAVGAVILWWRSYARPSGDRLHFRSGNIRHVLSSRGGWVEWLRPPEAANAAAEGKLWQAAAALRIDQFEGLSYPSLRLPNPTAAARGLVTSGPGRHAAELCDADARDALRPLLWAMDDPDRFVAAHILLSLQAGLPPVLPARVSSANVVIAYNGLRMEFFGVIPMPVPGTAAPLSAAVAMAQLQMPLTVVRADSAQLAAVRDAWDDKLCVQVASVPHWALFILCLPLPLVWLRSGRRRVLRRGRRARRAGGDVDSPSPDAPCL